MGLFQQKSDLQIQRNSHENSYDIFHRTRKKNPKVYAEVQKTLSSQSNPDEKEQCWKYSNT
jgi:hypothetical protein